MARERGWERFDRVAGRYDAWYDTHAPAFESECAALAAVMPGAVAQIEIGTGSGRFARALGIPWGIEPSPRLAGLARGRGIQVIRARAEALPLAEGSLDLALLVTVICFLDDPPRAFAECARVLRPDGVLVVGFLDAGSPAGAAYLAARRDHPLYRLARAYRAAALFAELAGQGLALEDCRQTLFRDPDRLDAAEPVRPGHGEGLFAAARLRRL